MCGRYSIVTKIKEIEKRFGVTATHPEKVVQNANVALGQLAPVITNDKPKELQLFQFGFTPSWAEKNMYVINARSEGDHNKSDDMHYTGAKGIIEKPMFRKAIRSQRCLVVADAFYEGPKNEGLSKPYCVYLRNGQHPFAFAGIWDQWVNTSTGELVNSFAVITTAANDLMVRIGHHRCPVILTKDEERLWLDSTAPLSDITEVLRTFPAEEMNAYPVSNEMKNPKSHGLHLLQPIGERVYPEYKYEIFQEIQLFGMGETRARERRKGEQGRLF
jgi:putative SOS response-associated peptidase YedK